MEKSITTVTDGQKKQYLRFVEDAAERALKETALNKDSIQNLIENGDEFQSRIVTAIRELSVSNQFADEEVQSSYAYPKGYKVKGITEQTNILRQLFPGVGFADEKLAEGTLPPNVEGWFAIPRWEKIAPTYGEAVQKVLDLIKQARNGKFYNHREGQLGPQYLRQSQKSAKAFQKLGDEQNDILVVPAQFGLHHKDRSVRRAREVFAANEFGLGAFAIGIMLLTHPEREVVQWEQHVDCAGDEFSPGTGGWFGSAPVFGFGGGVVWFDARGVVSAGDGSGSASGFLPQ